MALYQCFFYALAPEVQLKNYTIIEFALKIRAGSKGDRLTLHHLVKLAVTEGWISDKGFRHIATPQPDNPYCNTLITVRNEVAHGSDQLTPDCIGHIEKCADFINQLFRQHNAQSSTGS